MLSGYFQFSSLHLLIELLTILSPSPPQFPFSTWTKIKTKFQHFPPSSLNYCGLSGFPTGLKVRLYPYGSPRHPSSPASIFLALPSTLMLTSSHISHPSRIDFHPFKKIVIHPLRSVHCSCLVVTLNTVTIMRIYLWNI